MLAAVGHDPAYVFGNSSGAMIGLEGELGLVLLLLAEPVEALLRIGADRTAGLRERRARIASPAAAAENLLALEAILEPLGHTLIRAASGEAALRALLTGDATLVRLA